ncbi:MAG: hypothetical protein QW560_06120 [Candidatus Nitrosocaldus sp.]
MSQNVRERLWEARQQLYRLYDMESISIWKAKDLLVLNELFEEYDLANLLISKDNNNNNNSDKYKEEILHNLHTIKDRINAEISEANTISRDYKKKAILTKKLDKVLTLIALVEEGNKEGISRLIATYHLLNRNDKQLLKALQSYITNEDKGEKVKEKEEEEKEEEYRSTISKIKEDLEREIIELKKRL